jgi:hypothetical protein
MEALTGIGASTIQSSKLNSMFTFMIYGAQGSHGGHQKVVTVGGEDCASTRRICMGSVMAGVQRRGSLTPVCIRTGAARCPCPRRLVSRALMRSRQRGGERGFGGLGKRRNNGRKSSF